MHNSKTGKTFNPNITDDQHQLLQFILCQYLPKNSEVWIFGSRATQSTKPYSDLDLFIKSQEKINETALTQCAFALEESYLPYKVDLLAWSQIKPALQKIIADGPHFILFTVK